MSFNFKLIDLRIDKARWLPRAIESMESEFPNVQTLRLFEEADIIFKKKKFRFPKLINLTTKIEPTVIKKSFIFFIFFCFFWGMSHIDVSHIFWKEGNNGQSYAEIC